jgi:hypothetical protein
MAIGKLNWALIILVAGILVQLFMGWSSSTYTMILVGAGILLAVLTVMKITIDGVNSRGKGQIVLASIVLIVLILFGVNASWIKLPSVTPTASIVEPSVGAGTGATYSAVLNLQMKDQVGSTYAGSGTVYALPTGVVTDRNDLMKKLYDGETALLTPKSMTLTSGVMSYSGFNAKIGDTVYFAGYRDTTPGAAENVSFVKTAKITGITAGSTPEFMLDDSSFVWYNYPTLLFYDPTDTARTIYVEDEDSAIEKTLTFYVFPTNNGEKWIDANLWLESPSSSIAAIKRIKMTAQDGTTVTYGMPQELTTSDSAYRATPALTTSTDTMYSVGKFPQDSVRTSTTQKAKYTVEATYDHPASGSVLLYFKVTQNTNALTSAGGHYDSPSTNLNLNMTAIGTDGWS